MILRFQMFLYLRVTSLLVTCKMLADSDLLYLYLDSLIGYWFLFSGQESPAKSCQACTDNEFISSQLYVSVSSELWLSSSRSMKVTYTVPNVLALLLQLDSLLVTSFSICTNISKHRACFTRQYESIVPLSVPHI